MHDPNPEPFILDTGDRIDARNSRAQPLIEKKQGWDKTKAQFGLWRANATDRVGSWFNNPDAKVASGLLGGLFRGAAIGILTFGILSIAWSVPLWIIPACVVGFGAYDAFDSYQLSRAHDGRLDVAANADNIAVRAGALEPAQAKTPDKEVTRKADEIQEKTQKFGPTKGDAPLEREPTRLEPSERQHNHRTPEEPLPERGEQTARILAERRARHSQRQL